MCQDAVLAIDGPEEARRVHQYYQQLLQRQNPDSGDSSRMVSARVNFILRLPSKKVSHCKDLIQHTLDTLRALSPTENRCHLVGISADFSTEAQQLELDAILRYWSDIDSKMGAIAKLRVDVSSCDRMDDWLTLNNTWFRSLVSHPAVGQITLDITQALVAPKGSSALCTRITGFRQQTTPDVKRHYYIDDGCYGSLNPREEDPYFPMPLNTSSSSVDLLGDNKTTMISSTVWGPTCDGLDVVCRDIPLPSTLQRDDWLVFPNVVRTGQGTAFNGFDPPDTAYCVLGYFGK